MLPGPHLLTSPRLTDLGVPHAFTTRVGGVSTGPFASLNFGNPGELPPKVARDPAANIAENVRRVLVELGAEHRQLVQVHQVHGRATHVHAAASSNPWERTLAGADPKADAIVTNDAACLVAVRVADCCPVLLASRDGSVVAAVHAGWRGVIAGVVESALSHMRALGARDVVAAIGPCISVDHFEIGPEVSAEFRRVFGADAPLCVGPRGRDHADLKSALALQLVALDVTSIDVLPRCTVADPALFFSHRRDQGLTGRMIGVIGPASTAARHSPS